MMNHLAQEALTQLQTKIVPFWQNLKDEEYGGFYAKVGYDLTCYKKATKNTVQLARILYFFSEASRIIQCPDCRRSADHAYTFLTSHSFDRVNGGLVWSSVYNGEVEDPVKSSFAFGYGILALVSYYRLTQKEEALSYALELYTLLEKHFADEIGYKEVLSEDFKANASEVHRFAKGEFGGEKTMNTLLHLLEGYHSLYLVTQSDEILSRIRAIHHLFLTNVYSKDYPGLSIYFDNALKRTSEYRSFGHEIEASWMLAHSLEGLPPHERDDDLLALCDHLAEGVYREGFTTNSIMDETHNEHVRRRRGHWSQAEAVLGFYFAWTRNPKKEYFLKGVEAIWSFIHAYIVDKRPNGEWLYVVDQDGSVTEEHAVVWPWKGPYNNGRMYLHVIEYNGKH